MVENADRKVVVYNVPCFYNENIGCSLAEMQIYRYIPWDYLIDMIISGQNVLVSPLKWEDPFEAAVVKVPSKWHDGSPVDVSVLGTKLFAQCWCADNKESDLRWKAYGGGDVVRIGTTVGKLLESVSAAFPDKTAMPIATLFGKVMYVPQSSIVSICSEIPLMRHPELVSVCMLLKRDVYRQEEEWRLLIRNIEAKGMDEFREHVKIEDGLMRISITNPQTFLSEIMLGPYISSKKSAILNKVILDHGWECSIVKSVLMEQPSFLTKY